MNERHKHAESIHAWAEGKEIQYFSKNYNEWIDLDQPSWHPLDQYRLKPENPYGKYDKIIESVVNEVDFESIHKIMLTLGWTWNYADKDCRIGYKPRVPTIDDLKNMVIRLTNDLLVKNLAETSTGGFTVKWYNNGHHDTIKVSFKAVSDIFVAVEGINNERKNNYSL
jgi:hypothetical protein